MTTVAALSRPAPQFDIGPITRALVALGGLALSAACLVALTRFAAGFAPDTYLTRNIAVMVHLTAVLPAIPLGAWLLLSRKGTPTHKLMGKVWVALMVATAISALFIRSLNDGSFSWIHIFVPLTLHGAWLIVSSARKGDIAAHRKHTARLYLLALIIPGAFAFLPDRVMGILMLG